MKSPQEKLKEIDARLDEAHRLVVYLNEQRRELINVYDLNKK